MTATARKLQRNYDKPVLGRRFTEHAEIDPAGIVALHPQHPALVEGRTLFPTRVVPAGHSARLLVSGVNQRKLGGWIEKGPWTGFPIYTLTLEERATCPRSCHHWGSCYGNAMPWPRRHASGGDLIARLEVGLLALQFRHPAGFAVRLHILGDFFSIDYVRAWSGWLDSYPALHVFGFSAWAAGTEIGDALLTLRDSRWDRFAVRSSATLPAPASAITIDHEPQASRIASGIVCPAQSGRTAACGTCGLCWAAAAKDETIVFVKHGMKRARGPRKQKAA